MARKGYGFSDRFPHVGLFFIIALILAIPLTVWSLNNASTNFIQQAQSFKCGPFNNNPACPPGFKCEYNANTAVLGGSCNLVALPAPTGLTTASSCISNLGMPNQATFSLSWNRVNYATGYRVYGNYYYFDGKNLSDVKVGPYRTDTNSYTLNLPLPRGVSNFYWYTDAYNSVYNVISQHSALSTGALNCR